MSLATSPQTEQQVLTKQQYPIRIEAHASLPLPSARKGMSIYEEKAFQTFATISVPRCWRETGPATAIDAVCNELLKPEYGFVPSGIHFEPAGMHSVEQPGRYFRIYRQLVGDKCITNSYLEFHLSTSADGIPDEDIRAASGAENVGKAYGEPVILPPCRSITKIIFLTGIAQRVVMNPVYDPKAKLASEEEIFGAIAEAILDMKVRDSGKLTYQVSCSRHFRKYVAAEQERPKGILVLNQIQGFPALHIGRIYKNVARYDDGHSQGNVFMFVDAEVAKVVKAHFFPDISPRKGVGNLPSFCPYG